MKRPILCLGAIIMLFMACTKATDPTAPEDMLIGGAWIRTSLLATNIVNGSAIITNVDSLLDTCYKDNTLEFKTNYAGTQHLGNLKCSAGEPDQVPFYWQMTNVGKNIQIYNAEATFPGDNSINADVVTLTTNFLNLRYSIISVDPITQVKDTTVFSDTFRK